MKFDTPQTPTNVKEPKLQLFLPAATKRAIALRAADTGETVLVTVLRALNAYGFPVPEDALVDRRKPR